ncbi:MAG: HD domain-containing protein [Candidatus Omnitrophica bacterium]|nr:HD domain-containing protein [Candidatus Omnitrophota bacterium]
MKSPGKKSKKNLSNDPAVSALNFFGEAGLLKFIKRSGWWVAGIKDPETVAEHSFRCAIIGYYLAHQEKVDPYKVLVMTLFNDIHEARINDLHKMGHHYIDFRIAEKKVFEDQMKDVDSSVAKDLSALRQEYEDQKTNESVIARDADMLECLVQAKEYLDNGHPKAKKFFREAPKHLKSKSAKAIWRKIKQWDTSQWWERVVKFER